MNAGYYFSYPEAPEKGELEKFIGKETLEKLVARFGATLKPEPAYREHESN